MKPHPHIGSNSSVVMSSDVAMGKELIKQDEVIYVMSCCVTRINEMHFIFSFIPITSLHILNRLIFHPHDAVYCACILLYMHSTVHAVYCACILL